MASAPAVKHARRQLGWLIVITAAICALLGLGVSQGAPLVPKLALDLQGGTQILLAPKNTNGAQVTSEQVEQAVAIIRQRVDASGVSEAEVGTMGGSNILVSIPGKADEETLARIEASARLDLRAVLAVAPGINPVNAAEAPQSADANVDITKPGLYPDPLPAEPGSKAWLTPALLEQFQKFSCTSEAVASLGEADPKLPLITCDTTGTMKYILAPVEMTGDRIENATSALITTQSGASTGQWGVNLDMDAEGTKEFAAISQRLVAERSPFNQFSFVVDGRVISAPSMNAAILDGNAQISGSFTEQSAKLLADQLKHGALPISFQVQSQEDISATLGVSQLHAGLVAGLIGLVIVVVYSIFQYRGLALLTVTSLLVAALLTYLLLTFFSWRYGYRLSLAGVTGIIVSIGFTADSFIVYFERVRDALRDGMPLADAVRNGWKSAFRTILASDAIFFLAAAILFLLAVGNVRGFAFTLGLTTLVDLIVVALFTHPMLVLMSRTKFWGQGHPASGLDPRTLGARASYAGRGKFNSGSAKSSRSSVSKAAMKKSGDKHFTGTTIAERKKAAELAEKEQPNG